MEVKYNTKSPAVKRLMREAEELHAPTADYFAQPLEDNLFEWHFTVRGPDETAFERGVYHGRILLPPEYPMKPPSIIMLTPNGRFETGKKICLSISGHHPESWRPSWSIRTALMAIIGFLPTPGGGAIASLDYTDHERKVLAERSLRWRCVDCGEPPSLLLDRQASDQSGHQSVQLQARQLAHEMNFQAEKTKDQTSAAATPPSAGDPTATPTAPAAATATSAAPPTNQTPTNSNAAAEHGGERARTAHAQQQPIRELEPSWASNTLIVVLVAAIAALLCRRLFLLDARRLDELPDSL